VVAPVDRLNAAGAKVASGVFAVYDYTFILDGRKVATSLQPCSCGKIAMSSWLAINETKAPQ